MKNSMLAGCAAIAFAGLCGTAAADTAPGKFDIKLGGDASFTAGYVSQNTTPLATDKLSATDFTNRFRLQVTPTAKADNGMEYGANLRVRTWLGNGVVDADQAYVFTGGTFGRIEAGVTPGPNSQYGVAAPSGFGTGGVLGDWSDGPSMVPFTGSWLVNQNGYVGATFGSEFNFITNNNWATKVNYFTPRFFGSDDKTGLMGMVSYTPQNLSVGTAVSRTDRIAPTNWLTNDSACGYAPASNGSTALQGCNWKNIIEAGLRYDGTFSGVTVSGSFGYEHGDAPIPTTLGATRFNDLDALQVGFQVGYAGFLVGGSYLDAGKSGYTKSATAGSLGVTRNTTAQSAFTAGISYETGPVVVGFNYAHGEDAGDMSLRGSRTVDLYSVGATYTLAPGLTTSLEYLRSTSNNQTGFTTTSTDYIGANGKTGSGDADLILWKNVVTF
ncbi:MAG: porin [Rhodospirillaceae bacterium]